MSALVRVIAIGHVKRMNGSAMTRVLVFHFTKNVTAIRIAQTIVMSWWKSVIIVISQTGFCMFVRTGVSRFVCLTI